MSTEPKRTCPSCGNELSGAIELCPVCKLANLIGLSFLKRLQGRCALYKADWFEVLDEKLPSLAFSAVKRMLLDSGAIFETAIHYIQHSPAA